MNPNQSCILISQVWLTKERYLFKEMLEVSTKLCRRLNPTSFIILSGSGTPPSENTLKFCDKVIWQSENKGERKYPFFGDKLVLLDDSKGYLQLKETDTLKLVM